MTYLEGPSQDLTLAPPVVATGQRRTALPAPSSRQTTPHAYSAPSEMATSPHSLPASASALARLAGSCRAPRGDATSAPLQPPVRLNFLSPSISQTRYITTNSIANVVGVT